MTIAVLALQGAFIEHEQMLQKLGVHTIELRQASDLQKDLMGLSFPAVKAPFRENSYTILTCSNL